MIATTQSCNNATISCCANITGNLVPHKWYSYIKSAAGKPDQNAISILGEIAYWYKPGRGGKPKFQGDLWQTSYEHFHTRFGYDHQKTRRALVRLEELGLIRRVYRTIEIRGHKYSNVLFIELLSLETQPAFSSIAETTKKFSSGDVKFDAPSLQICREYIDKENKKENKESRSKDESKFFEKILEKSSLKVDPEQNKSKTLKDFLPLSEELYSKIQAITEKKYKIRFVNLLLEKLAEKYESYEFPNEKAFVSYMAKALENEIIEEKIANLENFTFDPNYRQNGQVKKFLNDIEDSRSTDLDILLKKKIVVLFESEDAYSILKNYKFPGKIAEGKYLIERIKVGEGDDILSEYKKELLFKAIENIFRVNSNSIEIVDSKLRTTSINNQIHIDDSPWGMVSKKLIQKYGEGIYISWFSKLDLQRNTNELGARILAPTKFIADWVRNNYHSSIRVAIQEVFPEIESIEIG